MNFLFCFIETNLNFLLYHMQKNVAYLYPSGELQKLWVNLKTSFGI